MPRISSAGSSVATGRLSEQAPVSADLRIEVAALRRGADPDDAIADADRRLESAS